MRRIRVTKEEYDEFKSMSSDEFKKAVIALMKIKRVSKTPYREKVLQYAKENRRNPTSEERVMYRYLKSKKVNLVRQAIIEAGGKYYIADFKIGNKDDGFIIEVDGGYHDNDAQREKDDIRDAALIKKGLEVVRITNDEVNRKDFSKIDHRLEKYARF